jgi:Zn-dependent peptidase ImmA (M78 family)
MKGYNTPYGIFYSRPYYSTNCMEEMSAEALAKAGIADDEPSEIPIEDVLEDCMGIAAEYSPLPADVMGCATFYPEGLAMVEIHENLSATGDDLTLDRRRRATIAHELGHGLAHTHLYVQRFAFDREQADYDPSLLQRAHIACRTSDIREVGNKPAGGSSYSWIEWQANYLMGALIVPRRALLRHLEVWTGPQNGVCSPRLPASARAEAQESVAETFHVSRQLAGIRLDGLFPEQTDDQLDLFAGGPA